MEKFVRIIAVKTLRAYWETHRDVEGQLRAWYYRAKKAQWQNPNEIKMEIVKPIRTETEYQATLQEIDRFFDVAPDTPEEDRLELLTILVEAYETEHYPILPPDPIEAILHVMDAYQLDEQDLVAYLGSPKQISEILSRRKPLTLPMIRRLHDGLGIPAEILIQPPLKAAA